MFPRLFSSNLQFFNRFSLRRISLNRPAPLPLPRQDQREFEDLQRKVQTPSGSSSQDIHPDARQEVVPEFHGDVNPVTGEKGGPKREPVKRWSADPGGDWSFKGRVSDF